MYEGEKSLGPLILAIISDIHANLEALEKVLNDIRNRGVEAVFGLGDIVGYGADPNDCTAIIREMAIACIMGNHDAVASGRSTPDNFNPIAKQAVLWTRDTLSPEHKDYLSGLPQIERSHGFLRVHGAISHPDRYIKWTASAAEEFTLLTEHNLCFFGHTHVSVNYVYEHNRVTENHDARIGLNTDSKYLINPGSVGQPRDRDPRASYSLYDTSNATVENIRLEYDIEKAQNKIIRAGLPEELATRLSYGY